MSDQLQRAKGCLLGLAIGDALGTPVEFKERGTFAPVTNMRGGGAFNLLPGQWTDDTSMALCLGQSLLDRGFDLEDQINKYVDWYKNGYMSVNGRCFDIGGTTRSALRRYEESGEPASGSTHFMDAGNGCIMRLAPVPIMYCNDMNEAVKYSMNQSTTTHGSDECIDACQLFGGILTSALQGLDKLECLDWRNNDMRTDRLREVARCDYMAKDQDEISGSGYVVESLEASLWCFYTTDNFHDAVLKAVNLGDDADTTGAITGQIAGAYYGIDGIPADWLEQVSWRERIEQMAEDLYNRGNKDAAK